MSEKDSISSDNFPGQEVANVKKQMEAKSEFPNVLPVSQESENKLSNERQPSNGPVEKESRTVGQMWRKAFNCCLNLLPGIGIEEEMDSKKYEELLRVGAFNIVQLIIPVSICMTVVVTFQLVIAVNMPVTSEVEVTGVLLDSIENGNSVLIGLINAIVIMILIILTTILLILLFKYRCYKAIFVWLLMSSALLVFVATSTYFMEILTARNIVADWPSFAFFVWNYGSLGLLVIHWKGPLRVQQGYLILNSAVVAIILLKFLPDWSTWLILVFLSIYDIIAVLCPKGPLKILIDLAKERGELNLPSLIYSSTMLWTVSMADVNKKTKEDKKKDCNSSLSSSSKIVPQPNSVDGEIQKVVDSSDQERKITRKSGNITEKKRNMERHKDAQKSEDALNSDRTEEAESEDEDAVIMRGFKIGLGDLVFYSVLVGKAASISNGNWLIILSCFVAILMGLCLTSLILGIVHRALPALPISIFFGLAFYFSSQHIIAPFVEILNVNQSQYPAFHHHDFKSFVDKPSSTLN